MNSIITKTLIGILVLAGSCATIGPSTLAQPPRSAPATSSSIADLCTLDGGRYCTPCGGPTLPLCPQADSGALCCSSGVCVIWSGSTCSGVLGWCADYTTSRESGIITATCHDGSGGS